MMTMRTITATESVTLDGVMQGIGRPDEDERGDFRHGGWAQGFTDEAIGAFMAEGMARAGGMLLGHRTYDDLMRHWTAQPDPNQVKDHLVNARKYVTTRDPATELTYPNSTLLAGEATETVARLREEGEGVLSIIGSGQLVRDLHRAGLVDSYVLLIHPIVLGSGTKLFGDGDRTDLTLRRSVISSTGVVVAEYTTG